jgi:hypothetical protein
MRVRYAADSYMPGRTRWDARSPCEATRRLNEKFIGDVGSAMIFVFDYMQGRPEAAGLGQSSPVSRTCVRLLGRTHWAGLACQLGQQGRPGVRRCLDLANGALVTIAPFGSQDRGSGLPFAGNRLQAVGKTIDEAGKYCFAFCG